jgi:hypothetical protein
LEGQPLPVYGLLRPPRTTTVLRSNQTMRRLQQAAGSGAVKEKIEMSIESSAVYLLAGGVGVDGGLGSVQTRV